MRTSTRIATLLVALTLLLTAIPILECCYGHARIPATAADAAPNARTHVVALVQDESARGCTDHAAPTQTPYIETSTSGGGSPASTRSATDAAPDPASPTLADGHRDARPHGLAADATGPPLWLTTCVSRT